MEYYYLDDAIYVDKKDGTKVHYFIFDEFEIHYNSIVPHTSQQWHFHSKIEEVIMVTKGSLTCYWVEDDIRKKKVLKEKEIIRVQQSVHTFANQSDQEVEFTVFRFVPNGINKHELIKNDKEVVENIKRGCENLW